MIHFFSHVEKELSKTDYFVFSYQEIKLSFKPILYFADLIGKTKVSKTKQCNGFYGCTLCTIRGEHFVGVHLYPHDSQFEMRSFEKHLLNLEAFESGSIESYRAKYGKKLDAETKTQSVN